MGGAFASVKFHEHIGNFPNDGAKKDKDWLPSRMAVHSLWGWTRLLDTAIRGLTCGWLNNCGARQRQGEAPFPKHFLKTTFTTSRRPPFPRNTASRLLRTPPWRQDTASTGVSAIATLNGFSSTICRQSSADHANQRL